jgi:acetyl-CoA C-acetyltransferase
MTLPVPVYIVSAARTPIGAFLGTLSTLPAPRLGAVAIEAALSRAKVPVDRVDEVLMGNVLGAGIGQAPARQAAIYANIPKNVPATTIGKVCGSGMQAVILGAKSIALGDAEIVVAGGMESMSNVPYYLPQARGGYRMGNGQIIDGMIQDGLWDPYNNFHMGNAGELCARKFEFSREEPRSAKAVAMTFWPRSWPSCPILATRIRGEDPVFCRNDSTFAATSSATALSPSSLR